MNFKPASATSVAAFVAIVALVLLAFFWAVHHAYRTDAARGRTVLFRTLAVTAAWLGYLCWLVASGTMLRLPIAPTIPHML